MITITYDRYVYCPQRKTIRNKTHDTNIHFKVVEVGEELESTLVGACKEAKEWLLDHEGEVKIHVVHDGMEYSFKFNSLSRLINNLQSTGCTVKIGL